MSEPVGLVDVSEELAAVIKKTGAVVIIAAFDAGDQIQVLSLVGESAVEADKDDPTLLRVKDAGRLRTTIMAYSTVAYSTGVQSQRLVKLLEEGFLKQTPPPPADNN